MLKPAGSGAVGHELAFFLRCGLVQFSENIQIAFAAKKETACSGQSDGIVLKGGQLIHRAKTADVRTDVVRGAEHIPHVEQSRRASAAPRVTAPAATSRGEKQGVSLRQFIRLRGIDVDTGLIGCQQQGSKPQPPYNGIRMVRPRCIRQPYGSRQQPMPLCGKDQGFAFAVIFDELHRQQIR